jgi:hypothetical protein
MAARDKSGALPVRAIEAAIAATGVEFTAEQRLVLAHERATRGERFTARRSPITQEDLWARAAEDVSRKPYKTLAVDLLAAALKARE